MEKFIALYSKDQFFIFNDMNYYFKDGEFVTDSPDLIEYLNNNTSCKLEVKAPEIKETKSKK